MDNFTETQVKLLELDLLVLWCYNMFCQMNTLEEALFREGYFCLMLFINLAVIFKYINLVTELDQLCLIRFLHNGIGGRNGKGSI